MLRLQRWLRFAWTSLTSMRTALILLLILGVAAIPGSFLPQRPTDPVKVGDYLRAHPDYGPWLDRLGFFDVFGSAWFAAIYLLLFTSLIGCIVPRTAAHLRELRSLPPRAPGRLNRLAGFTSGPVTDSAAAMEAAQVWLREHRYRVRTEDQMISAERGYLRETGNLIFHCCLVLMLIGLAWGSLFQFRGTAIVVEGAAFSNTLTQYDEFSSGAAFKANQLSPFTLKLDSFSVRFETGPVQTGAARGFDAAVTVERPGTPAQPQDISVNAPIQVGQDTVHLLGHGYAPVVTVKDGNGDIAFSGPVVFLPQDANLRSEGVIKVPDARPDRLAFEGVFLPTAVPSETGMVSAYPDALDPELLVNAWSGAPKVEDGSPENVYSLDKTGLTQVMVDGSPATAGLKPGTGYKLPDGLGTITFDGWKRWTKLQISNTPGGWLVLGSVLVAIIAMSLSLSIRPRRLFVRLTPSSDAANPSTVTLSVAGLDKAAGRSGVEAEAVALAQACGLTVTVAPAEEKEDQ